jgi:ATP synthase protein I
MTPGEPGRSGPPPQGADDARLDARLAQLDGALRRAAPDAERSSGTPARDLTGFAQAARLGSEFVAGVLVGLALGFGFDAALGTSPGGLIVLTLLGFAAGVMNLMRAVGALPPRGGGRGGAPR